MSDLGMAGFEGYHRNDDERTPTRKDLKDYFILVFDHEPTEKQLEVFLDIVTDRAKDVDEAIEFCEKNLSEQKEKI